MKKRLRLQYIVVLEVVGGEAEGVVVSVAFDVVAFENFGCP